MLQIIDQWWRCRLKTLSLTHPEAREERQSSTFLLLPLLMEEARAVSTHLLPHFPLFKVSMI